MGKQRRRGPLPMIGQQPGHGSNPADLLGPVTPGGGAAGTDAGLILPGRAMPGAAGAGSDPLTDVDEWLAQEDAYQEALEAAVSRSIEEGVKRARAILDACDWQREERVVLLTDYRTDDTLVRCFFDAIIDPQHAAPPFPEPLQLGLRPRMPSFEDLPPFALETMLSAGLVIDLTTSPWGYSDSYARFQREAGPHGTRLAFIWGNPEGVRTFLTCAISSRQQDRAWRGLAALNRARTLHVRSDLGTDFTVDLGDPADHPRAFIGEPPRQPGAIGAPICTSVTAPFVSGTAEGTLVFQSVGRFQGPIPVGFGVQHPIRFQIAAGRITEISRDNEDARALANWFEQGDPEYAFALMDCNIGFDPRGDLSSADNAVVHSYEGGVMIGMGQPYVERPAPEESLKPGFHLDLMFPGTDVDLDGQPFIRRGKFTRESGVR